MLLQNMDSWAANEKVGTPLTLGKPLTASYIQKLPLGVVLIIGPWNYPVLLILQPLCGAIAAGCVAVLKPSEVAPHTSALIAELIPRYLDPQVVRVVEGAVPETTALLKQKWDHIFYTGNSQVARIVMRAAAEHLTPVTLELGGKNPVFVLPDCDIQLAARRILSPKLFNCGQSCIAADYVLVEQSVFQPLVAALKQYVMQFLGTDPKTSPDLGRIVNDRHFKRVARMLNGEKVLFGGETDESQRYIAPTALEVTMNGKHACLEEEIFGPILPLIKYTTLDEAVAFARSHPTPLACYVFSYSQQNVQFIFDRIPSGGACVNDTFMHAANANLPFGGFGESGTGAYHGKASFDVFVHRRSVLDASTWMDMNVRYQPFTPFKSKVWRSAM